jgi:phage terminase Nu1 subunit (DNA packaging protein)
LRGIAAGRCSDAGADARARLGHAQASLAETKARQLAGELVEASEVEKLWTSKLRAFRNRILGIPEVSETWSGVANVLRPLPQLPLSVWRGVPSGLAAE